MHRRVVAAFAAAFALVFAPPAFANEDPLYQALDTYDTSALSRLIDSETDPARAALARGALAAIMRNDAVALDALSLAADAESLHPDLRRVAWATLSDVHLRHSRFTQVAQTLEAARAVPGQSEPEEFVARTDMNLVFARALAGVAPMRATLAAAGETPVTRDLANLARATATINGGAQEAVLDTGAGFSTITQGAADRLGLRMIDADVTVGSVTGDVAARLAVADTLTLAGGEFHDVVFIVLPDAALSFADGAYTIPAIIGFPILLQLGRLEFLNQGEGEVLRHSTAPYAATPTSNLHLEGLQPVTLLRASGTDTPLRMLIDTGARSTNLTRVVLTEAPSLLENASQQTARIGGAAGVMADDEALTVPQLTLTVGDNSVTIADVGVYGEHENGRHGVVGQDLLRSGGGYVIDFNAMRFEVLP